MPTITRLLRKTAMFSGEVVAIQQFVSDKTFSCGNCKDADRDEFRRRDDAIATSVTH